MNKLLNVSQELKILIDLNSNLRLLSSAQGFPHGKLSERCLDQVKDLTEIVELPVPKPQGPSIASKILIDLNSNLCLLSSAQDFPHGILFERCLDQVRELTEIAEASGPKPQGPGIAS